MKRPRLEVNLGELDQLLDRATQAPLSEPECDKIKTALHALVDLLLARRTTEKTSQVVPGEAGPASPAAEKGKEAAKKPNGHGRTPAAAYTGAKKVPVPHPGLKHGDRCPACQRGNVYEQKTPKPLVRIVGQAPLQATVYELQSLRCNGCGQLYDAPAPEGAGPEKFDETATAMIAQLKYGSGLPWKRLEALEGRFGIPLPAATQWEAVEEAAELLKPAYEELIRQAAQGEVVHNDDTGMRVLKLERPPGDERNGVFTTGVVSVSGGQRVALYFTGRQHAGENLADVLRHRAPEAPPPIQMCDALSRNEPELSEGAQLLLANCLAHGRRQFVNLAGSFPEQCRYVLETLGKVYLHDAAARRDGLTAAERLHFHQQHSGPLMDQLEAWFERQLSEKKAEPNSGLGKAIRYFQRHWDGLTAFLRLPGAPLDNNICERALKKAVLHRKNALFYRTIHGAGVGDLYMSPIHTCEVNSVNSCDYLIELQRNAREVLASPGDWLPWNYRESLPRQPNSN